MQTESLHSILWASLVMDSTNLVAFLAVLAVIMGSAGARVAAPVVTIPQEAYWNSELPNTPMPKSIRDYLPNGIGIGIDDEKMLIPNNDYKVYTATGYNVTDDEDWSLYFSGADLHRPGKTMKLHFVKSTSPSSFVQRKLVQSMPFSTVMLSEIFRRYSVKPGSQEAEKIESTIGRCSRFGSILSEDKACTTSLESMVDFATVRLGNNIQAFSTEVKDEQAPEQDYTFQSGSKKIPGNKVVICHKLHYPYAVFYCHSFKTTEAHAVRVPLRGSDGTIAEALAICHTDTSEWSAEYHPLKMLNLKPGGVPLCHFLAQDTVVFSPKA